MTIDHDAIAARVRQDREDGTPGPWEQAKDDQGGINYTDPCSGTCWNVAYAHYHCGYPIDGSSSNARRIATLPDLEAAYLDLYNEVAKLRADLHHVIDERDATFALMLARAEKAEAERDALRAAVDDARGLLVDAMVQLTDGKIKTRRNRALLIQDFLSRDKEQPND